MVRISGYVNVGRNGKASEHGSGFGAHSGDGCYDLWKASFSDKMSFFYETKACDKRALVLCWVVSQPPISDLSPNAMAHAVLLEQFRS